MTVAPGSVIGIIGGGQLGRMLAMAAAGLGYRCHIYAPDADGPAAQVAARFTQGAFDNAEALAAFADEVDVVTYEFENVAIAPLAAIAARVPLHPPVEALAIAQDRLAEKSFIERHGGTPAAYAPVDGRAGLDAALATIGAPAVLKTRRFGYDGKGQARIETLGDADAAWEAIAGAPALVERFVDFDAEFSILLCRGADGEVVLWDAPVNRHKGGILVSSTVPAGPELAPAIELAETLARRVADALGHVGMLTLEFFACGGEALFNEMAPRVHNSGHWTIEGAATSQFENHIRAICGLPLGATGRTAPRIEMLNLVGTEAAGAEPGAHLHLYGKSEARPGRKMGHVTRLLP